MPEWLKKLIKKWKEQGIDPVPGTWMADLFEWDETGKMPRVLPGEVSPIEALLTHPGQVAGGLGQALSERTREEMPGFLDLFNVKKRLASTPGTKGQGGEVLDLPFGPPVETPPVMQFGGMGTLSGPTQPTPPGIGSPGLFPGSTVTGQPATSAHEAWRLQQVGAPKPKPQLKPKRIETKAPSPPKIRQISRSPSKLFRRRAR